MCVDRSEGLYIACHGFKSKPSACMYVDPSSANPKLYDASSADFG